MFADAFQNGKAGRFEDLSRGIYSYILHKVKFGWDEKKAEENLQDHGVAFDEAQEVFFDRNAIDVFDSEHSTPQESRYNIIGLSSRRLLFVAYTELEDKMIWLISARKAEAKYRKQYEKENP